MGSMTNNEDPDEMQHDSHFIRICSVEVKTILRDSNTSLSGNNNL